MTNRAPAIFALPGIFILGALLSSAAQQSATKPVAGIRQLHDAMITPASDALFRAGQEPPKDDAGWTAVRNNALLLAESGNLLMLAGRAKDEDMWMKMSRAMLDAAETVLKAAEAKKIDDVVTHGDDIVVACQNCHERYRDNGRKMGK